MSSFNPAEWSKTVNRTVTGLVTVSMIIGLYLGVDAWADDKITKSERAILTQQIELQVRNEIDHDKIVQQGRLVTAETNLRLTDLQLEMLEDEISEREEQGLEPTARQGRKMDRLLKVVETYESVQIDATSKLTKITTTTTVTTTTTEN